MGELINGRTPEEIKTGLRRCRSLAMILKGCTGCPYNGCDGDCDLGLEEDALALIEHLESERDAALAKVPKWISIQERLPQDGQKIVMINEKYPSITLQGIYKADKTPDTIRVLGFGIGKVTHWMPLPEPPKEGE